MNRRALFSFLAALPLAAVGGAALAKENEKNKYEEAWRELLDAQAFASFPGSLGQNPDGGVTIYLD
jgi:hypothetical protein